MTNIRQKEKATFNFEGRSLGTGGLLVRILGFHCGGLGSIPGWGTEISQGTWFGGERQNFFSVVKYTWASQVVKNPPGNTGDTRDAD